MSKRATAKEIKEHPNQAVRDIAADLDKAAAVDTVAVSEGGKILLAALLVDVVSSVDSLCANYKTFTMQQFIAECASMKANIDLIRAIKVAHKNKKFFEESLAEEIAKTEE